jgi:hypothetical protein
MPAGRPKKGTPKLTTEEQAARQRAAKTKYDRTNKHTKNERRAEKRFRFRKSSERARQDALTVTSNVDHPKLRWMDTNGDLHAERELSAEQLIAHWQKEQEKKK